MGTKIELLQNLLDEVKERLTTIQNERTRMNDDELPTNMKKKITDENFQKIIKLKNDDINTILSIKNEILALNEEDVDLCAYKNDNFEDKITELNKSIDQTFIIVDQMKREIESLMNSEDVSNEFEDEDDSIGANRSNEFFKNNIESNSYGESDSNIIIDTRSNNDYILEVFGKPLKKAIASVILHQPNDPIAYLAAFLHNYRKNELLENAEENANKS